MIQILVWLLLIEGLWLAGFPLAFLFLRRLPDRGFASSPALGLLLISYLVWLIASFAPVFNPLFSWLITILFFAGLNGWLFWRRGGVLRKQLIAYFRARWQIALLSQLVFLVGFFLIVGLRAYLPDIHGGEKFPDYSIYQALLFSQTMPIIAALPNNAIRAHTALEMTP